MVRPNAEVIPSDHLTTVKIVTQNPISSVSIFRLQICLKINIHVF